MSLFDKNTFLQTPTPTDVLVYIKDVDGVLVLQLDPMDTVNCFVNLKNVKIKTKTDVHTLPFSTNTEAIQALTLLQNALDTVRSNIQITQGTSATTGPLGLPTDGAYGGLFGAIAGVAPGDKIEDAFDKVETVLGLLVPAKPANLSAVVMTVSPSYSALEAGTGTLRTTITDVTQPVVTASNFFDAKAGILTAKLDTVTVGTRTLVAGSDVGTYGALEITDDSDPYIGQAGKEGFWKKLIATITPASPLTLGSHTFDLNHSVSGTSILTVYIDDPLTPNASGVAGSSTAPASYTSGVPHLTTGGNIIVSGSANNTVSKFYNSTRIVSVSGNTVATQNYLPSIPPIEDTVVPFSFTLPVLVNTYNENSNFTLTLYNSKGATALQTVNTTIRVDSVSNEVRVQSGVGQFPVTFGAAFLSSSSILATEELQMINGLYQFPPQVNYAGRYPSGPDYSTIVGGSYNNMRWVTFDLGRISSQVGFAIQFNGTQGSFNGTVFGVDAIQSNFALYAQVKSELGGDVPTAGWVDANAGYPGVGVPTNNGDPALVIGSSHGLMKTVTFSTPRTGRLYLRVGIPQANNKKFTGVTKL
jgi:hypothetical protein